MWAGSQPSGRRLAGKTVARHRRNHDIERIGCISAVCGGIGQRIDDLHLFGDRAGPSVRNDQRQRVFVFRADVNEVNVQPIDLGEELRKGVQLRFDLAPVIFGRPVARQRLGGRELHALRRVCDGLPFRKLGRVNAPAEFGQVRFPGHSHGMGEWRSCQRPARRLVVCQSFGSLSCSFDDDLSLRRGVMRKVCRSQWHLGK